MEFQKDSDWELLFSDRCRCIYVYYVYRDMYSVYIYIFIIMYIISNMVMGRSGYGESGGQILALDQ